MRYKSLITKKKNTLTMENPINICIIHKKLGGNDTMPLGRSMWVYLYKCMRMYQFLNFYFLLYRLNVIFKKYTN